MSYLHIFLFFLFLTITLSSEVVEDGYCGYDGVTYPTVEALHKAGTKVMHCAPCGACSTINDVDIYWKTKGNLTRQSRICALFSIFSKKLATFCMEKLIHFTPKCNDCWIENILCDRKKCMMVCLWSLIKNEPYVDKDGKLNKCLQCDEDNCGPAFKKCAGANRRRSCIESDIFRDKDLICKMCEKMDE